jgi:hypothetical protein
MGELTLESLARRVEALEVELARRPLHGVSKDWRKVIGMFRDSEFMREVDEECQRSREAERELARQSDREHDSHR